MGTNYYWYEKTSCDKCGRNDEPIHIGKSSVGWCFGLHVDSSHGIHDLEDWKKKWKHGEIKNEYNERISAKKMLEIITKREGRHDFKKPIDQIRLNNNLYPKSSDWNDFFKQNHAEAGPNGLLRHAIDEYCIGHGKGTWDLMVGEFS